jgi:hypothetical protein
MQFLPLIVIHTVTYMCYLLYFRNVIVFFVILISQISQLRGKRLEVQTGEEVCTLIPGILGVCFLMKTIFIVVQFKAKKHKNLFL